MPSHPPLSVTAQRIRPGVFAELERHIQAFAAKGGELIPLHIGDTHLSPPNEARFSAAVASETTDPALYRYGPVAGLPALRDAIAEKVRNRRGILEITGEHNVHIGAGGTHALFCAARATLDAGDDVLVAAPYWPLAPGIFHACGARPVEVPFTTLLYGDPSLDAGDILREALTPRTKAVYLISPNNPDGKVLARKHLEQVAAFAVAHDLWVFADEVYADTAFEHDHTSIASLTDMAARTLTLYSFSKSHALAGARVGYVIAAKDVVTAIRRVGTHTVFNVPLAMQRAALGALTSGDTWTETARAAYRNARDASALRLEGSPIRFSLAEGGTYLFLDFSEVLGKVPMFELLARAIDHGVLLAPGDAFGRDYEHYARLCFTGVPLPRVLEGIDRLRAAVDALSL